MPVLSVCQSRPALLTRAEAPPRLTPGAAMPALPPDVPGSPAIKPEPERAW